MVLPLFSLLRNGRDVDLAVPDADLASDRSVARDTRLNPPTWARFAQTTVSTDNARIPPIPSGVTRAELTAVIERDGDGFVALCPEVDVASQGSTVEEARGNLEEALELFFETASDSEIRRRLRSGRM